MAVKRRSDATKFVMFDVLYEDGSRASNRKVPSELLGGLDGDQPARTLIVEQDQRIAEASGRPARGVTSIFRSDGKGEGGGRRTMQFGGDLSGG